MLHQVFWPPHVTYLELLDLYVKSVRRQYADCHVVFDGYNEPSIKDQEHLRRTSTIKTPEIQFTVDMRVAVKHEDFLSNSTNKVLLISKLYEALVIDGQEVTVSKSDADTDIVQVALKVVHYLINLFQH